MDHKEIRKKFLDFFERKGHKIVPSSSLIPDDPSVLFTTAGMQQFKPYYTNPELAPAKNVASIQKCLRTSDIDKVGDESHLTFFEMMGNFSFGGYGKKEAIEYAYDFITKELGLKIDYVSVFGGEGEILADEESENIWKSTDPAVEVKRAGKADNFWGPTGDEGPCGPTTEIFVKGSKAEIWNIVFNEYYCAPEKSFKKLDRLGVDTGMGLERLAAVVNGKSNVFETDLFKPLIGLMPSELDIRIRRVIADHSRAIAFLIADGVRPSNKEQGYVLRRLIRRVITHFYIDKADSTIMHDIFAKLVEIYGSHYSGFNTNAIIHEFDSEKEKFDKILPSATRELEKIKKDITPEELGDKIVGIYESQGMPIDSSIEFLKGRGFDQFVIEGFENTVRIRRLEHQEKSRAGVEKKFGKQ